MGIINVTPDSFYDGGNTTVTTEILFQANKMIEQGATFLDIGGYSSRPGGDDVSEEVEINRVIPAIEALLKEYPETLISVDTFRSQVAQLAVEAGAVMINDISGGQLDDKMFKTVAKLKVPYVLMHMRGTPKTMQNETDYDHLMKDILSYFAERSKMAIDAGINDLILDPGFGFSKTISQNFELLDKLENFKSMNFPFLVGISRKSMIYKTLESKPEEALNGTTALHAISLLKGASILRVHDVKEAVECVTLLENLKSDS
ncbi:MAG: dihydropteroate synthase [Flavobacteriaceae bacterium]|nr:dihydropteroate synthase [Flavobacteriaceae bacterium]